MKRKTIATILALALTTVLALPLSGCSTAQADDLMEGVTPAKVNVDTDFIANSAVATSFALELFQNSLDGQANTLISPLSVLCALSMTANGAQGETLEQMESVLGLPVEYLNAYLHAYMAHLPEEESYKLSLANSIWFTDDESFTVEQEFLQINADFYGAGLFKAPFDSSTCQDINRWVEDHTDGMIQNILEEIPEDAVMFLVNALSFEAEWQSIYYDTQVRNGVFTKEDGQTRDVELMYSSEYRYLEDEHATGFLKYYDDQAYAFAALLPKEGVSVAEYVSTLTGEGLNGLLANPVETEVTTAIPKFETEYTIEMSGVLQAMGMTDAFDYTVSDFSGIGSSTEGNLVIDRVLHKTFISVGEKGTRAGAATAVQMDAESAAPEPTEPRTVILDRPFVYLLMDCKTNLPFFLGTVVDIQ